MPQKFYRYIIITISLLAAACVISDALRALTESADFYNNIDFIQEYLLAKAIYADIPPYKYQIHTLAELLHGDQGITLAHASAHPPITAILLFHFQFIHIQHAHAIWIILTSLCIFCSFAIINRSLAPKQEFNYMPAILAWSLTELSSPRLHDRLLGQWNPVILLFSAYIIQTIVHNRYAFSGKMLGVIAGLKLSLAPCLLLFAGKNFLKVAVGFTTSFTLILLISLIFVDMQDFKEYLSLALPQVSGLYHAHPTNFSLLHLPQRLFTSFHLSVNTGADYYVIPPKIVVVNYVQGFILSTITAILFFYRLRSKILLQRFIIGFPLITLLGPLTWNHYMILGLLPLFIVWITGSYKDLSKMSANLLITLIITIFFVDWTSYIFKLITIYSSHIDATMLVAPAWVSFVQTIPTLAYLLFLWILASTNIPNRTLHS